MSGDTVITQRQRLLSVETALDFDVLLLDSFVGAEEISRPFRLDLKLLADVLTGKHRLVNPEQMIGTPMTVTVELPDGRSRIFHGICRRFSKDGQDNQFAYYHAEVVPAFALLSLTSDCRIFQKMSVPEIIEQLLNDLQVRDFRFDLDAGNYKKWDYCVQYRESDFNFLSRLMEQEGIFYYFEHKLDGNTPKHTLVMGDGISHYKPCPNQGQVRFTPHGGANNREDVIRTWETRAELLNGQWAMRDYHFEMPRNRLEVPESSLLVSDATRSLEIFDYPGEYAKKFNEPAQRLGEVRPEGERAVRLRMELDETRYMVIRGVSNCRAFCSGFKIKVVGTDDRPVGTFLLASIQHAALQNPGFVTRSGVTGTYDNSFTCIPADRVFRPERRTPKPVAHGPQTAFVIDDNDPPREEIWPDQFGRVKVRFHWDRDAQFAAWLRVAQPWAGKGWGHQWIPRVGHEVVVDFLNGDPDEPIIIGSVYNSENTPPFTLPGSKTVSGIKTRSSPGGGEKNFNMVRFEDLKGHEVLEIHAERTMIEGVEASQSVSVGANQTVTVGGNRSITTGGEKDGVTHGDTKELVYKNRNLHVKGDSSDKIDGKSSHHVVGDDVNFCAAGYFQSATNQIVLSTKDIYLDASSSITLSAGPSTIIMNASGITISGPLVKINPMAPPVVVIPIAPLTVPPEDP